jgi:hypothetical protein
MRLVVFGTVALAAAGLAAYDKYDKTMNYQSAEAHISAVNEQCYMEKVEGRRTSTSDVLPCERAIVLAREHPKWQGYEVKHRIELRFTYVSPVDGATHASSMTMSAFPKGQPLHAGDVLRVLASKIKADKTREL